MVSPAPVPHRTGASWKAERRTMELKQLAWFFEDQAEASRQAFLARIAGTDALDWFAACEANLMRRLFMATHKVLMAQYKLIESQVAFDDFCASLRQPEIREYLHERYPVMRVAIENVCNGWLEQACAITGRFARDADLIRARLLPDGGPPEIKTIRFGLGDHHRGGRSVAILEFRDGRKLAYKPRSLSIDTHFGQILDWAGRRGGVDLRVPAHLEMDEYGWVEFVAAAPCADASAVDRFYFRMGSLLALLYVLEGNDFHYENIIAVGEHPVLIDLESFFCPFLGVDADAPLDASVLAVGMLPNRLASAGNIPEISGLSDATGQFGLENLELVRNEDDSWALVRRRGVLDGASNLPSLDGARIGLQAGHADHLKRGFEHIYRAILAHPAEFSALVEACANDQIRVLFRHTAVYGHLIEEARHPQLMASVTATADHYALLRIAIEDNPAAARFVDHEIADLHRGDVPMFTAAADGRDLWYADDGCIPDFFKRSGMETTRRKLAMLSPEDLSRQLWIIGNAFITHSARASAEGRARAQLRSAADSALPLEQRLVAQATTIAAMLREQMHVDEESASWLVYLTQSLDNSDYALVPAFYDLYSGIPGEVLFFSQLAQITGGHEHMGLARKALHHLKRRLDESGTAVQSLGLYVGWGSVIHAMTAMAQLQSRFEDLEYLERLLADSRFDALIEKDRNFSIIKGTAGFMLACSDLHLASGSRRALQLAEACAAHLIAHRWPGTDEYAWRVTSAVPLSGLAHGASGFAMAFARLYEASGDPAYRDIALSALAYERTLFDPVSGNWEDRRDYVMKANQGQAWRSVAWAHGAPGIGLARLAMLRAGIDTPPIREELEIALRTTLAQGFDGNDSLIFGRFGNLELLVCYNECFGQDAVPDLPDRVSRMLDRLERDGPVLLAPAAFPIGLLSGATGIAYQCLRLARMHQVPSVLCGTSRLPAGSARGVIAARDAVEAHACAE
jgi:type 2 lantibiotic biosynthesis protein LanM